MSAKLARTAVVTGASRGIGRAATIRLSEAGWRVWAVGRAAEELADLSRQTGCMYETFDLADASSIAAFCAARADDSAPVAALINNAGVMGGLPIAEQDLEDFERMFRINVTAPWLMIKGLNHVLATNASIVNVGSVASVAGFAGKAAYCASKHALAGLTRSLANEFAPRGIRVNLLVLGSFETPGLKELAGGREQAFAQRQLLNRLGRPEEAADAIEFLVSEKASFMTGSLMTVDGGLLVKASVA